MGLWFLLLAAAAIAEAANEDVTKNRPVTKVINLLKDMQKNLQKEAEEDEEVYNRFHCWCETNDKEKVESMAQAEADISSLLASIESLTANSARLGTEIEQLTKEVAENTDALNKATELRKQQLAEFNEEEKDSLQSISALKAAVTVLGSHHRSFMQMSADDAPIAMVNVAKILNHIQTFHPKMVSAEQKPAISAFLQDTKDFFDAANVHSQSYAPQSGQIFGILKNMKETFEKNLSGSQKEELTNQAAYQQLKAAKEDEIAAGQARIEKKTDEKATADENNANDQESLENTKASLSADQKFLKELKEKCQLTDQEWEARQKTRTEEIAAVGEALNILAGDDAHDLFTRTFNFVQKSMTLSSNRRDAAAKVLNRAALTLNKPKLAQLATSVKLNAFTRVKKAIDDMVKELLQEKDDEIKKRDYCIDGLNVNDKTEQAKTDKRKSLDAAIKQLENQIENLDKEIEMLEGEVQDLKDNLKQAGENRDKANKEFQQTRADQVATQQILAKAVKTLEAFYKTKAPALMQQGEPAGPPPPPGFKTYKKNKSAGGVLGMMRQIMTDTRLLQKEAEVSEKDAQAAYETFAADTDESMELKNKSIMDKTAAKAEAETDLADRNTDLDTTLTELEELANTASMLHRECDYTMKNFEVRQTARDEEVESLRQAKAILSGAKFAEFLQRA